MTQLPQSLTIVRPDDWHLHLRDNSAMASVLGYSLAQCGRVLVMPNLKPAITTVDQAFAYRRRIMAASTRSERRHPVQVLMTLYLTDHTPHTEVLRARENGVIAFKLYPAGATTNSADGVTDIRKIYPVLEMMQAVGMVLCVHGEVTDPAVDIFDREAVFIDRVLIPLRHDFPELKVVMEHITTMDATKYILASNSRFLGATITAHHLLYNRNALFMGGLRPHWYCLPVLKSERHRMALVNAATSGAPFFFLGTDSAPHAAAYKEQAVCAAGCFTAPTAIELYAEAFETAGALSQLEAFASFNGADFYGFPRNINHTVTLVRQPWQVPESLPFGDTTIKPFRGGETLQWKLA